jgi:fluoride exporter
MSFLALWISVGAIGGLASVARFIVHGLFPRDSPGRHGAPARSFIRGFPVGTLAVNLSGSFGIGLLAGAGVGGDAYLLAGTAALGSYTTFSTWILDSERLVRHGRSGRAATNILGSLALGVAAAELGRLLTGG